MKTRLVNLFILFCILIIIGIFYKKLEDTRLKDEEEENNDAIQKYLLNDTSLAKAKKPILWIYVPYEYNSRHWTNFGSRSSTDLNQPYLYLTVKSIINKCNETFTICIIDNTAFSKLIPNWSIDLKCVANPIKHNVVLFGLVKLIYIYGGLLCPISFLCMKDLQSLYAQGTSGNKMFICETVNQNVTPTDCSFYPSMHFFGAPKENMMVSQLINFMERVISTDYTAESIFLGKFNQWCEDKAEIGEINKVDGCLIGTKNTEGEQIILDDLMSNNYLKICHNTFGILIPCDELLKRRKFGWFIRSSAKQVLESDTIIGNYLLIHNAPTNSDYTIEPFKNKPNWVAFWKTPLYDGIYGLKPQWLGDNILKVKYPGR